ncbi:hypothetical protein KS18_03195 [Photorhabdus luminescens]|nr:DMT family transporter [Photorhabdus aegyptia]KGM29883.1 hypothetical protein KS18_03195 [Photorhabdus luminescens]
MESYRWFFSLNNNIDALFVAVSSYIFLKLGAMNAAVLVIAGQMLSAVLLDWLYQDMTPGLVKIVGVLFVLYHFSNGEFVRISDDIVRKKDVIAINQQVYDRSSFDVSIIPRCVPEWHYYMTLGRRLHALQSNPLYIGLMSSGYSSESNNDLSSAKRMRSILNALDRPMAAFYFCIGGGISQAQYMCEGMKEDVVHMKGPVEITTMIFSKVGVIL